MGLKSLAVLMVIGVCWWLIRRWSQPQYPAAQDKRANLNRRLTDTVTHSNTLKPHDLELRRLQKESQVMKQELEQAHQKNADLQHRLAVTTSDEAARQIASQKASQNAPETNRTTAQSVADPENA